METASKAPLQTPPSGAAPPGWGNDDLTKFWDAARQNQFGTFARKPIYGRLADIDELFVRMSKDWLNPPDEIAAMLFLRCHSAFRAAAGLAAAGQVAETYVMNRAVLEYAAYALHLHRDAALRMIWLNRHQSAADMKASRDTHAKVLAAVTAVNQHAAKRFEDLYQHTIDFGGHPNERSVTGNMQMVEETDRRVMLAVFQHGDGPQLDLALMTTARCAMVAFEILQGLGALDARFELLGINAAMPALRQGL